MKKVISILFLFVLVISIAFAFTGCGKEETGTFYTVTEAYEQGYLTREDVMSIAYYNNGGIEHNEEAMDGYFKPLPISPEELSVKTEKAIKQTHFNLHWKDRDLDELEKLIGGKLEITIEKYYGTYKGCVAVMVTDTYSGYAGEVWYEEVDKIKLCYGGNSVSIWVSDKDKRELSADDIAIIRYGHKPTIDEEFIDNEVWVILRSAYNNLTELRFKELDIIKKVSDISYVWSFSTGENYESGKILFEAGYKNQMFKIVLKEHSKENVLKVVSLLDPLDIVLWADPSDIYETTDC